MILNKTSKTIQKQGIHRQRLIAALNRDAADRIPLTLGSPSCSVHKESHKKLQDLLGLSHHKDPTITDEVLQIVETDERILDFFDIDLRWLLPKTESLAWNDNKKEFIDTLGRKFAAGGGFYNQTFYPLQNCDLSKVKNYSFPELEKKRFSNLGEKAHQLYDDGYGIGIDGPWGLFEISSSLVGTSEFLMSLILNPNLVSSIAERVLHEYLIPFYDQLLKETASLVQIIGISDDLGSQAGLLFSPTLYRKIFKPLHRQLVSHIRSKTDAKIFMHSDGSIMPVIPDLIEIGVDGLNPVQYTAKDMQLERLIREFGSDLCFFGGVVENEVLSYRSPTEIRALIQENIAILKKSRAFIFAPIHNISQEVPAENIIALYQAGAEFGCY